MNKNIALIVGLVVVAVAGYFTFTRSPAPDAAVSTTSGESSVAAAAVGQELVIELNRLKALRNINTEILSEPAFESLVDYTQPIPTQPLGRLNPFAPIGSDN
ncbi:MAG: hypothetical protein AAB726_03435 [Patescibacteria group bacterium]